ncbi:MAG: hypothetical protein PHF50_00430 [Patescibacteria group bacterium]|nr:hypothetical protein [Patescibacteria group bacterium]
MKALKSLLIVSLVLFFSVIFSNYALAEETAPILISPAPSAEVKVEIKPSPAPTLIAPNQTTITAKVKPLIIGLTKSGSLVKIFIDGVYNGKTEILNHESGTANFSYTPFLNLSRGWHEVYAMAENKTGGASKKSAVLRFNIELPMPAPTIFKPVVNKDTSSNRPFIVGLAKNDSKIKVYIDKKLNGEFEVKNHPSGIANFAYKPVKLLERGSHLVHAVAVDKRGKQSSWSNPVYFSVKNSAIAQSAVEEKSDTVASIKEPEATVKVNSETPIISKSSGEVEKKSDELTEIKTEADKAINKLIRQDQAGLDEIKSLIRGDKAEKTSAGQGMINEGKSNQGKLKLSLVLFILFLVGVVAWLLWVNRELVKERRAQNEAEEKTDKEKEDLTSGGQKDKLL